MKKDLPENIVENICIAIVMESATPEAKLWNVYLINLKDEPIETVLVSSKGYGSRLAGQNFPVGPDTLFSVGSVSKVATAALCLVIYLLVDIVTMLLDPRRRSGASRKDS